MRRALAVSLLLAGCSAADRVNRAGLARDVASLVTPHGGAGLTCQMESSTRAGWCVLELGAAEKLIGALELKRGGTLSGGTLSGGCVAQEGFAAPAWSRGKLMLANGGAFDYLRLYLAGGRACVEVAYSYG